MYQAMHVHVTKEQYAYLRWASDCTGLPMAQLVRQAIDQVYEPDASMTAVARFDASGNGNEPQVEPKRVAQAGLVGIRGRIAERVAQEAARRTSLSADTLKTLLGAYLVLSRVNSFRKMVRRARADG